MPLNRLLADCGFPAPAGDQPVHAIRYDSRDVTPGDLFVAVSGFHVDGHDYADAAVNAGAVAVIAERELPSVGNRAPVIVVDNSRVALSRLAAELAGHPSRSLSVVGITGTDGKTTTSTMLWAAWRAAGLVAAASTTVDFRVDGESRNNASRDSSPPTTGEAPEVQARLRECFQAGCSHVALETSSHALELHRVDSVGFVGAVYTRITSEHLELHGSLEGYIRAKSRLLHLLDPHRDAFAVFDFDDPNTESRLRALAPSKYVAYSGSGDTSAEFYATNITMDSGRTRFVAHTPWGEAALALQIPGRFNVSNALAERSAFGGRGDWNI